MAEFAYTIMKQMLGRGELDMHTSGDRFDILLCMTNTDADTTEDAATIAALSLDEYDGDNYARKTPTVGNYTFNQDTGNDRAEWDNSDDVVWTALGQGTRAVEGALVVKYVDGTNDIPILWITSGGIAGFEGNTGNFTVQWNAQGIAQVT